MGTVLRRSVLPADVGGNSFLWSTGINPLNAELNPICHLLAFAATPYIYDISRLRVNLPNWMAS
jgi:hypothetical protein